MANRDLITQRYRGEVNSSRSHAAARDRIHWMCNRAVGVRVLDLGCSQGIASLLLGREGFDVVGVDVEEEAIAYADADLAREPLPVQERVRFVLADLTRLDTGLGRFDTVLLGEVVEHFAHPERPLEVAHRHLRVNGRLVLSVPFGHHPFHDHKQTFYVGNLLPLVDRFFHGEELAIDHHYLLYVGRRRPRSKKVMTLADHSSARLAAWMRLEEDRFLEVERRLHHENDGRRARLKKLEEQRDRLQARVDELVAKEDTARADVAEHERKELRGRLEQLSTLLVDMRDDLERVAVQTRQVEKGPRDEILERLEEVSSSLVALHDEVDRTAVQTRQLEEGQLDVVHERLDQIPTLLAALSKDVHRVALGTRQTDAGQREVFVGIRDLMSQRDAEVQGLRDEITALQNANAEARTEAGEVAEEARRQAIASTAARKRIRELEIELKALEGSFSEWRRSIRFRVATELAEAVYSPRRLVSLPRSLWRLWLQMRRRGGVPVVALPPPGLAAAPAGETKKPTPAADSRRGRSRSIAALPSSGLRNCVLVVAVNGAGLGHLTRSLAVARRLGARAPDTEIVVLTTSPAINLVERFGFKTYYHPTKSFRPEQTARDWNDRFARSLRELVADYRPCLLIFDGVTPYGGLRAVLADSKPMRSAWIARANWKEPQRFDERIEQFSPCFDLVIVPGELGEADLLSASGRPGGKVVAVPPMVLIDREELLSRDEALQGLGLSGRGPHVLIQLGAGNINEVASSIACACRVLRREAAGAEIVLAESAVAQHPVTAPESVAVIKEYPLGPFLSAFDLVITAAGYNSFHEVISAGVPAIFFPNVAAVTDDQLARARRAERLGLARVLVDPDEETLTAAVRELLAPVCQVSIRQRGPGMLASNGAAVAAEVLSDFLPTSLCRSSTSLARRLAAGKDSLRCRPRVASLLGEPGLMSFFPEAAFSNLDLARWQAEVEEWEPEMLLVESDSFQVVRGGKVDHNSDAPLPQLISWCRARAIPTAYWDQENAHSGGSDPAALFDHVFTTSTRRVPTYVKSLGHQRIHPLPFAAQPLLHNPIGSRVKSGRVGFAGPWPAKDPDRERETDWMLEPCFERGLDIYEEAQGAKGFPKAYRPYLRGHLPYEALVKAYRRYDLFLNIDQVSEDATRCSRRIFEVLASGTCLISSYAQAVDELLGPGLVPMPRSREEVEQCLDALLSSPERCQRLSHLGVREVLGRHTCERRFAEIVERMGLTAFPPRSEAGAAILVLSEDPAWLDLHVESLRRQKRPPESILIVTEHPELAERWDGRLRDGGIPFDILVQKGGELSGAAVEYAPDWVALFLDRHLYSDHYLADLLLARDYSFAEVVGKATYYVVDGDEPVVERVHEGAPELDFTGVLPLASALLDKRALVGGSRPLTGSEMTTESWNIDPLRFRHYSCDRFSHLRVAPDVPLDREMLTKALAQVSVGPEDLWAGP